MGNDCPIPVFSSRSTPDGSSKAFPSVPSKTHVRILSLSSQDIVSAIVTTRLEFLGLIAALVDRCLPFWLNPPKGFHAWNA
jgi:hypothetical protein